MIRMKQVATKITEYVKKSKRAKLYGVFGLIYLIAVIFVMNDAWLYQTPIAKLTKVETSIAGENKSTRGTQEIKYKQKIRIRQNIFQQGGRPLFDCIEILRKRGRLLIRLSVRRCCVFRC